MRRASVTHYEHADVHSLIRKCCVAGAIRCEHCTDLEQPDRALHVRQVEFGAPSQRVEDVLSEKRFVFR